MFFLEFNSVKRKPSYFGVLFFLNKYKHFGFLNCKFRTHYIMMKHLEHMWL